MPLFLLSVGGTRGLLQSTQHIAGTCHIGSAPVEVAGGLLPSDQFAQVHAAHRTALGVRGYLNNLAAMKAGDFEHGSVPSKGEKAIKLLAYAWRLVAAKRRFLLSGSGDGFCDGG